MTTSGHDVSGGADVQAPEAIYVCPKCENVSGDPGTCLWCSAIPVRVEVVSRSVAEELVREAVHTARGWIERGCPPESRGHVLAALELVERRASGSVPLSAAEGLAAALERASGELTERGWAIAGGEEALAAFRGAVGEADRG